MTNRTSFVLFLGLIIFTIVAAGGVAFLTYRATHSQDLTPSAHGFVTPTTTSDPSTPPATASTSLAETDANDPVGLPISHRPHLQILHKPHFTIGYDNDDREPAWVSYRLAGPITVHGKEHRPAHFATDPTVDQPAHHEDYTHSGFDRGHMCPAYALFSRFGPEGLAETFITSNIIPQRHQLNAGHWEQLEQLIAGTDTTDGGWAERYGEVWVTDGPVLEASPERLTAGEAIPRACFLVISRKEGMGWSLLAFEMPNDHPTGPMTSYLVSVRHLEEETGLDFDAALPREIQDPLETTAAERLWP